MGRGQLGREDFYVSSGRAPDVLVGLCWRPTLRATQRPTFLPILGDVLLKEVDLSTLSGWNGHRAKSYGDRIALHSLAHQRPTVAGSLKNTGAKTCQSKHMQPARLCSLRFPTCSIQKVPPSLPLLAPHRAISSLLQVWLLWQRRGMWTS